VLFLGVVMAVIDAAGAHAIPGLPGAGLLLNAVHVAAMGLWVGGLMAFLRAPDRRFTPYAVGAFAVSVGSGTVLALAHVGFPPALPVNQYGLALAIKVAVVLIALAAAALGRRRTELGVVAVILAAAAVLVSLPPPR
jgi:putative copper export protein